MRSTESRLTVSSSPIPVDWLGRKTYLRRDASIEDMLLILIPQKGTSDALIRVLCDENGNPVFSPQDSRRLSRRLTLRDMEDLKNQLVEYFQDPDPIEFVASLSVMLGKTFGMLPSEALDRATLGDAIDTVAYHEEEASRMRRASDSRPKKAW